MSIPLQQHYPINTSALPKSWVVATIGEVFHNIKSGFASGEHSDHPPGVIHLRPMNIDREGRLTLTAVRYVLDTDGPRIGVGDVLFNNTNSRELVGKTTTITGDTTYAFSNHMTRLQPPQGVSARFTALQLHYLWMAGYFRHLSTQHVNQASISSGTLTSQVPFVLPPSDEQERIVAKLNALLSKMAAGEAAASRALARLERFQDSLLRDAMTGKLTRDWREEHPAQETAAHLLRGLLIERRSHWEAAELGRLHAGGKGENSSWKERYSAPRPPRLAKQSKLPPGWTWASLEQVSVRVTVGHVGAMRAEYVRHGIPFLRSQNVRANKFDPAGLRYIRRSFHEKLSKSKLIPGDVVVVRSGNVGTACMIPETLKEANCADLVVVQRPLISGELISYYMNSIAQRHVAAGKVGIALTHFNTKSVALLPIAIPPKAERVRIVELVAHQLIAIANLRATLIRQLEKARATRQSVFREAFAGDLIPQNPADEPASTLLARIQNAKQTEVKQPRIKRMARQKQKTVETPDQLEEIVGSCGGSATPERLLLAAGLEDNIETFFDLLRGCRDKGSLIIPVGGRGSIRRVSN